MTIRSLCLRVTDNALLQIRYWIATSNKLVQAAQTAKSALTGSGEPPGELRIITSQELQLVEGLNHV